MIQLSPNPESRKALFLGLDGTLTVDPERTGRPKNLRLVSGSREGVILALEAGYRLFLQSNLGSAGPNEFSQSDAEAILARLFKLLKLPEGLFTEICISTDPPFPDNETPSDSYNKPSPRFIREMIESYNLDRGSCYVIGDSPCDWQAGLRGGIQPVAVRTGTPITPEWEGFLHQNRIPIYPQFFAFARAIASSAS